LPASVKETFSPPGEDDQQFRRFTDQKNPAVSVPKDGSLLDKRNNIGVNMAGCTSAPSGKNRRAAFDLVTEENLRQRGRSGYSTEAQRVRVATHGGDAKADVGIQIEAQFLRPLDDVLAVHSACESLIFHLLTDTWDIYIEDRFGGFHERYGGQKTG
jgi:hypothetical protein